MNRGFSVLNLMSDTSNLFNLRFTSSSYFSPSLMHIFFPVFLPEYYTKKKNFPKYYISKSNSQYTTSVQSLLKKKKLQQLGRGLAKHATLCICHVARKAQVACFAKPRPVFLFFFSFSFIILLISINIIINIIIYL